LEIATASKTSCARTTGNRRAGVSTAVLDEGAHLDQVEGKHVSLYIYSHRRSSAAGRGERTDPKHADLRLTVDTPRTSR
jgi:hypothetical protein